MKIYTSEEKATLLRELELSEKSQRAFAREKGIGLSTLAKWQRKNKTLEGPGFVEVSGVFPKSEQRIEIEYQGLCIRLNWPVIGSELKKILLAIRESYVV